MNVLAFDSSCETLAVALRTADGWSEASSDIGLRHAERLVEMVESCLARAGLAPAQLDLIACALGPGSFTGLRIGMSTAKGMSLGLGKPWVAVPTLDALAWGLEAMPGAVVPIIDGRKGRFYSAIYAQGKRSGDWLDLPLASFSSLLDTWDQVLFTGPDARMFEEIVAARTDWRIDSRAGLPAARGIAVLGAGIYKAAGTSPAELGPLYLRPSEAEESAAARRNRGPEAPQG